MKKVLVLTHEYYPFHGGVGRYCYNLFKYFSSDEYLVLSDQKELPQGPQYMSQPLLSLFWKPRWQKGLRLVHRVLKEKNIGIIFTPHILPLGIIAYYLHSLTRIPYVISLHGKDINLALANKRKTTMSILRSASAILVNSKATGDIVAGLGIATPVHVITPYLEEDKLTVDKTVSAQLQKKYAGKKLIITVGRLVKRKGQDTVLRALPEVLRHAPDAYYCIIGAGPDRDYLKTLIAELKLQKHAEILDAVPDAHLGAYYAQASVFAMPTRKIGPDIEGFGIVYLEAASFGLPIIAGRSGGESEALGEGPTSLLIGGEDTRQFAEIVSGLLVDVELATYLGQAARKHLLELPHWDAQSKKLHQLIETL